MKITIVAHSRDKEGYGMNHKVDSPKITYNFPRWLWGNIGYVKLSPKKLLDQSEMLLFWKKII